MRFADYTIGNIYQIRFISTEYDKNLVMVSILIVPMVVITLNIFVAYLVNQQQINQELLFLLVIGALGWLVAFLRIFPLQVLQYLVLSYLGADLQDPDSIAKYSDNVLFIVWGPIFAGLFEGYFRYYFINRYQDHFHQNSRLSELIIFGLGWSNGEILILYLFQGLNVDTLYHTNLLDPYLLAALIERISATLVHVSLSIMVIYAIFRFDHKVSLYLVMILHFLFDFTIILWILLFQDRSDLTYLWSLEIMLFLTAVLYFFIAVKLWRPHRELELIRRQGIEK